MKSCVTISLVPSLRGGPWILWDDLATSCRKAADLGFAANLLGTLAGGLMEYSSLLVGYRHLMLFVGLFYALALLTAPWKDLGE